MAAIDLKDLTDINGNGVFDKLAAATLDKLQEEFKNGRITATDYSKVYISSIDSVIAQSVQFLLQKDISANQAELIAIQKELVIAQRDLAQVQKLQIQAETELTQANTAKVEKETEILDKQSDLIDQQILLAQAQVDKVEKEILVLNSQINKIASEISLINAQASQANKQVEVLTAQLANIPKEGLLLDKQVAKAESEKLFLDQRVKTEKAQIADTVDSVAVAGIIGKQRELYAAQTKGFERDSLYKLGKGMMDTWSVRRSTDDATVADNVNKLSDANIGAVMTKIMVDLNITPV